MPTSPTQIHESEQQQQQQQQQLLQRIPADPELEPSAIEAQDLLEWTQKLSDKDI